MTKKRILVTGSAGLLGSAVRDVSNESGHDFVFATRKDADLEKPAEAAKLIRESKPDVIFHLAALVGGVRLNMDEPELMRDRNRAINESVLSAALAAGVPKTISLLSSCIFPKDAPEPWVEDQIHGGEPDERQWGYAVAKRELDILSRSFTERAEGKSRFITLMPTTLYGPNDNFDPENSHVIPAIILKILEAAAGKGAPVFWGSGKPRREFTFSKDMARALLWAADHYDDPTPMIISAPKDESIRDIVEAVSRHFGYAGEIKWDTTKPEGRMSRRTDTSKFQKLCPGFRFTPISDGLAETVAFAKSKYPNLRGLTVRTR